LPATFYNENTTELAQQYLSKTFEEVHESWCKFVWFIKNTNIEQPTAESFDAEANIALPGLNSDNSSVERVAINNNRDPLLLNSLNINIMLLSNIHCSVWVIEEKN